MLRILRTLSPVRAIATGVWLPISKPEDRGGNREHDSHQHANYRVDEKPEMKKLRTEKPLDFAMKEATLFPRDNPEFGRS